MKLHVLSDIKIIQHECKSTDTKKVDYDLYYKDSGSVNKGHYVESNMNLWVSPCLMTTPQDPRF